MITADLLLRHRLPKRSRTKARREAPKPPNAPGVLYLSSLNRLRREWHAIIVEELRPWLYEIAGHRTDAPLYAPTLLRKIAGLRVRSLTLFTHERLTPLLANVAGRTAEHARKEVSRVIGIPLKSVVPEHVVTKFQRENVQLIQSLAGNDLDRASDMLAEAQTTGLRVEELAKQLKRELDVNDSRAALIARDQTLKLNAEVASDRMQSVGITEYVWVTSKDERVRDEHAALDGETFSFNDPPVTNKNGARNAPGKDYQCVTGDTSVSFCAPATKAYRRWYAGDLTTLVTASGETIRATPNHPVLTGRGWLSAHLVKVGDYLVEIPSKLGERRVRDPESGDASAEEVFRSLSLAGNAHRVSGRTGWFHGDVTDEQIDVVDIDRGLRDEVDAHAAERVSDNRLSGAYAPRLTDSASDLRGVTSAAASYGCIGSCDDGLSLAGSRVSHSLKHGFAFPPALDFVLAQDSGDRGTAPPESHLPCDGKLVHAVNVESDDFFSGKIERGPVSENDAICLEPFEYGLGIDAGSLGDVALGEAVVIHPERFLLHRVESVASSRFDGFVYNFETTSGWFCAHGLIIHNCRCTASPIIYNLF